MNSPRKPAKKAPGRPKKAAADKLEQFSVRLPPKLKLGLDLLARAQHRSLSQAVEWAVQVGLNSFSVNSDGMPLGALLDVAWSQSSAERRLLAIYDWAPSMLSFEERATVEYLKFSHDLAELWRYAETLSDKREEDIQIVEPMFWDVAIGRWGEISKRAVELANAGKPIQGNHVARELGLFDKPGASKMSLWEIYRREHEPREA